MKHPALLVTLAALTGCTDTRSTTLTPELEAVVDSNTAFALDLYQRSAAEHENLILSPMSISSVLSMTMAGAAGETAAELGDVLRVDVDEQDTYHEQFGGLMQDLDGRFDGYQINIANQLFGTASIPWNDDFITLNEQDYGAPLQETDFSNSEGARRDINRWVKRQTSGMIPELLQPDQLNAATVLVLANAIYFQGDWAEAFDPDANTPPRTPLVAPRCVSGWALIMCRWGWGGAGASFGAGASGPCGVAPPALSGGVGYGSGRWTEKEEEGET